MEGEESSVRGGRRKTRKRGDDGLDEWGGCSKTAKMDMQVSGGGGIFRGISIRIIGLTDPPERELWGMFMRNGGRFTNFHDGQTTTYVIARKLSAASERLYRAKTLRPEWLTDSVAAGRLLDPRGFFLYFVNNFCDVDV